MVQVYENECSSEDLEEIVSRLDGVMGPDANGHYKAHCVAPYHRELKPTMKVSVNGFRCFGCGYRGKMEHLVGAVGINIAKDPPSTHGGEQTEGQGITLSQLAEARGLDIQFLTELGWEDTTDAGRNIVKIPYPNASQETTAIRTRRSLDGSTKFSWRNADKPHPYGLPAVEKAAATGYILFVQGETDYARCAQEGIPAIGIPGANTWKPEWASYFETVEVLYAWQEPGQGGERFVEAITRSFPEVRIVVAPPEARDPCELGKIEGQNFVDRMKGLMGGAKTSTELESHLEAEERKQDEQKALHLLTDPALLYRFNQEVSSQGLVGEQRNALILYLALRTRTTDRPVNVAVKGPAASGKSTVVDKVVEYEPEGNVHVFTAHSERSLIYSEDEYQHKFIYYQEAAGIGDEESIVATIIRSITAKSDIHYETTIRGPDGNFTTQKIEKSGPVGLLLTTVDPHLGSQLETRLLTLESEVSSEHSRQILSSIAESVNGTRPEPELALWHSLCRAVDGFVGVHVEFGEWLADQVKIYGPRVHRDFESLLRLVQASAIVHQYQGRKSKEGEIEATVADYAMVYTLLEPTFLSLQREGLSTEDIELYNVVAELQDESTGIYGEPKPLSQARIAERLRKAKSSVQYKLEKLKILGLVVNRNEGMRGRPADYRTIAAPPRQQSALPEPGRLAEAYPHLVRAWVDPLTGEKHTEGFRPGGDSSTTYGTPVYRDAQVDEYNSSTWATAHELSDSATDTSPDISRTADIPRVDDEELPPANELDEQLWPLTKSHYTGTEGEVDEQPEGKSIGTEQSEISGILTKLTQRLRRDMARISA